MMRRRGLYFSIGIFVLVVTELLRWYLIMPLPGSQLHDTVALAYFLHRYMIFFRMAGALLVLPALFSFYRNGSRGFKSLSTLLVALYAVIYYLTNYEFAADAMFLEPAHKVFLPAASSTVEGSSLVIGVESNGEAKAYPIQFIGYHHMVQDTVGGTPVYITYCTVCRSGRAFNQYLNGNRMRFRLVGMDHFNAMFEDLETKSWWRQENGVAIAGKMKGNALIEFPSRQVTLDAWLRLHPKSLIMQPDPAFADEYRMLIKYGSGEIRNSLEYTDSASWSEHSWVIGLTAGGGSKAYDWKSLVNERVINDEVGSIPIVIWLENDLMSFHAYRRMVGTQVLQFEMDSTGAIYDSGTHSLWDERGRCTGGELAGNELVPIRAYQEFWFSWKTFHPQTNTYPAQ